MRRNTSRLLASWLAAAAWFLLAGPASGDIITFSGPAHGSVVSNQFPNLIVSATNLAGGPDLAVIFDTESMDSSDLDLFFPGEGLGNALIIQEHEDGCLENGICDDPDDEGDRPAGFLTLLFTLPVTEFGLTLLDIENDEVDGGSLEFVGGASMASVPFQSLAGTSFGDNSINVVAPITAASLGLEQIDQVTVNLRGSGAIDDVNVQFVPEPGTFSLVGLGLAGLVLAGRRRRPRPSRACQRS